MRMSMALLGAGVVFVHAALGDGPSNAGERNAGEVGGEKWQADNLPATLDLDPKIGGEASEDTKKSFATKPVGARQKWQLDKGYFDNDERVTGVTPLGEASEDYSGIRLRRPRKP
jgi:hypothetical protein